MTKLAVLTIAKGIELAMRTKHTGMPTAGDTYRLNMSKRADKTWYRLRSPLPMT